MRNVIFDIGNVLVDFHPIPYYTSLMPEGQMDIVCPLIFDSLWEDIDRGDLLCTQAKELQLQRFPQYQKQIECIYEHWMQMMFLYEDTMQFYLDCKKHGYAIYLLSNIGEESHQYLKQQYPFFDMADGMVLSYQEHCIKPQKQIYEILLERYHLKAEECVFFDDRENNIAMARQLGMQAICFHHVKQAKEEAKLW